MKKFVFFYAFVLVIVLTTILLYMNTLDKKNNKKENTESEFKENIEQKYEELDELKLKEIKEKIKLKISSTGEIKELKISEYIKGVLPAEMPPEYHIEALKAQAVVARTYLYKKMSGNAHNDADICDNPSHCQAWYSLDKLYGIWQRSKGYTLEECNMYFTKVEEAVDSTENIVVTYKNKYINAYFHACSGDKTEDVSAIWGKQNIPYLVSVESKGEEGYKNYTSKVKLTVSDLETKLNNSSSRECSINKESENVVEILSYTKSGRVDKVKIGGVVYKAEELRTLLGLRSTNFTVNKEGAEVVFNVKGNGHGVGMSQVGADYYAKEGFTYIGIIKHYYTGVNVTKIYVEGETKENEI